MTPIQEKCIPEMLNGRDVLGVAQTGTGKTAAYLLPILSMLDDGYVDFPDGRHIEFPQEAINCVIMAPTRELAQQIDQAMQGFGYYLPNVSSVAVYGGNDGNRYYQELNALKTGASVIIATPGRFISHLTMDNVDMSKVSFFVLDEADRMLDMGFSDDILKIASFLPKTCQTVMFSATMPDKIEQLAKTLLKNPVEVKIAVSKPAEKIQQSAYVCYEAQKLKIVEAMFKAEAAVGNALAQQVYKARGLSRDLFVHLHAHDLRRQAPPVVDGLARVAFTVERIPGTVQYRFHDLAVECPPVPEGAGQIDLVPVLPQENACSAPTFIP